MKYIYLFLLAILPGIALTQNLSKNAKKAVEILETGGDPEEAISILQKEIKKHPNNGILHYYVGSAKNRMNPFVGLEEFNRAIELDTTIADAYAQRALLQEDNQASLKDMDKAILLDPANFGYYFNRAGIRLRANDFQGAISDADKSIELEPGVSGFIYVTKAEALSGLDRNQEALEMIMLAANEMGFDFGYYIRRGEIKLKLNDKEGACDDFQRARIAAADMQEELPEILINYLNDCN